jgi:hypothetical protein
MGDVYRERYGPTLANRSKEGLIPLDNALAIARLIADALETVHEKGIAIAI